MSARLAATELDWMIAGEAIIGEAQGEQQGLIIGPLQGHIAGPPQELAYELIKGPATVRMHCALVI